MSAKAVAVAGTAVFTAAVAFVYHTAVSSYFFNDDFQWLQGAASFAPANLLKLERYDHFYRPVIEVYFYLGRRWFACDAAPFHLASIGIHLLTTFAVFHFARTFGGRASFAFLSALFFTVQPGHVEAVAWVGAITDMLPALWYVLALWMYLLFLQGRGARFYAMALLSFVLCLLTHESSATLLPMMVVLEATLVLDRPSGAATASLPRRALRYVPFAALLAGYLALEYVVSNRSYLVREGNYAIGWHAVPHAIQYIGALLVWNGGVVSYAVIPLALVAVLVWGTPIARFATLWMLVALMPASFFTWGNNSRYLYLPAIGFSMLLADLLLRGYESLASKVPARVAHVVAAVVVGGLVVRSAVFAQRGAAGISGRALSYERLVAAAQQANPAISPERTVYVDRVDAEAVPAMYVEPAVQAAYCAADIHVVVR